MTFDITKYDPCEVALEWYNKQPSFEVAWQTCEHASWMIWLADNLNISLTLQLRTVCRGVKAKNMMEAADICRELLTDAVMEKIKLQA